ncbi:hypothetical protein HJFPF1_00579 [Paramyrothecium foliicola]|nr:hypothetical protein HJFPF1_00579 [Paramyrothecium foliicola]
MLFSRGPPTSTSKFIQILLTFTVVSLLIHFTRVSQPHKLLPFRVDDELPSDSSLSPEEHYLARLATECQLTNETSWVSWRVQHTEESREWSSTNDLHLNFRSNRPKVLSLDRVSRHDVHTRGRLQVSVPSSAPPGHVDASEILFGVATTYGRIAEHDFTLLKAWSRWLTNGHGNGNGASIIVMLDQATDAQVAEIDTKLQAIGIDAYVTTTDEAMSLARRYYELVRILKQFSANLEANGQHKRWFGLVEDTIFFPGLTYLIDRLFSYNTDETLYLGLPSEKADWETQDGNLTTYGGGAVFLTRSALGTIPRLSCFETGGSKGPVRAKNWDVLLQECIQRNVEWKMHVLPGFYSPNDDTQDSSIGSYETGLQPLLLHRYEDRHQLDVGKAHLVTNICGEACFMQRYVFHDNWVLVNGVSITEYPDGLEHQHKTDAKAEEAEEKKEKPDVAKHLIIDEDEGVERKALAAWKGRKNVWRLMDSAVDKSGAVWQAYIKKADTTHSTPQTMEADSIDSVIVLVWDNERLQRQSRRGLFF